MAAAMNSPEVSTLVLLLEHQRTLYRRLRFLAEHQKALVVQEDAQPLIDLLGERQKLVDGLLGLSEKLAPYRTRWTEVYTQMDEPNRHRVTELLEEANVSLSAILQTDRRDTAILTSRQFGTARQLNAMETGARASAAYAMAGAGSASNFTDAQG